VSGFIGYVNTCMTICGYYYQPSRSTQPFILPGSINEYQQYARVKVCVGWQVTLCDPIWQVISRAH